MTPLPAYIATGAAIARDRFMNGLRILRSIDADELDRALGRPINFDAIWERFRVDPYRALILADDETSDKLWALIESRQPARLKASGTQDDLVAALKGLVEERRRDDLCDPDQAFSDEAREEAWGAARAALVKVGAGAIEIDDRTGSLNR